MQIPKPADRRALRLAVTPIRDVVVRDATGTGDGSWTMEGYAAVFDQETTLWDISGWWRVREEIDPAAFDEVLARLGHGDGLVHFNFGHDMNTSIAATDVSGVGGLELSTDFHGLRFFARVDPDDPDAIRLAAKMRRGVVRQASFAFTIEDEELVESGTDDEGTLDQKYRITKVGDLYDVCACPQGAYAQTESHLRSLAAASLSRSGVEPEGFDRRAGTREVPAGETTIAPDAQREAAEPAAAPAAGEVDPTRQLQLARMRAAAAVLTHNHPKGTDQ